MFLLVPAPLIQMFILVPAPLIQLFLLISAPLIPLLLLDHATLTQVFILVHAPLNHLFLLAPALLIQQFLLVPAQLIQLFLLVPAPLFSSFSSFLLHWLAVSTCSYSTETLLLLVLAVFCSWIQLFFVHGNFYFCDLTVLPFTVCIPGICWYSYIWYDIWLRDD